MCCVLSRSSVGNDHRPSATTHATASPPTISPLTSPLPSTVLFSATRLLGARDGRRRFCNTLSRRAARPQLPCRRQSPDAQACADKAWNIAIGRTSARGAGACVEPARWKTLQFRKVQPSHQKTNLRRWLVTSALFAGHCKISDNGQPATSSAQPKEQVVVRSVIHYSKMVKLQYLKLL